MATPNYQGRGQPAASGSGWLGSWLGGTPVYKGAGQPASKWSAAGGSTSAYKPSPSAGASDAMTSTSADASACPVGPIAIVIPRDVIEEQ